MVIAAAVTLYQGYKVYGDAKKYGGAGLDALSLLRTPGVAGLQKLGGSVVEIVGLDNLIGSLVKHGVKLAFRSRGVDASAMDDMLALMRERVPRDTGRLFNGISGEIDDDGIATVTASAVRDNGFDYAFLVEHGTKAGVRGRSSQVADANYFEVDLVSGSATRRRPSGRATRRSGRTHPGTEAQPFFFNSAREVLAEREQRLEDAADASAQESGLA